MKDEIIKILKNNSIDGWSGDHSCIGEIDFEKVAEELVKLLPISTVSQQRELLIDFYCQINNINKEYVNDYLFVKSIVEDYIKSNS